MKDDFAMSQLARKKFREEKKRLNQLAAQAREKGLNLTLLPESEEDAKEAAQVSFQSKQNLGLTEQQRLLQKAKLAVG